MRWPQSLTLFVMVIAILTSDHEGAATQKVPGPSDLVLRVQVPKRTFALYETVLVSYSVENPTDQPIKAIVEMMYSAHHIQFSITSPEGKTNRYLAGSFADVLLAERVLLPGSVKRSQTEMGFNAFPTPGKYQIHARMGVGGNPHPVTLSARPVEIEIVDPTGKDAEAIQFFPSKEEFLRLTERGPRLYCEEKELSAPQCLEELDRFLRQHSESVYAPYVMWSLAEAIASGGLQVTPRYDSAIALLRRFLETWPDHPDGPRVMYNLAFVLNEAGRRKEAVEMIDAFERKYPNRPDLVESLRGNIQGEK